MIKSTGLRNLLNFNSRTFYVGLREIVTDYVLQLIYSVCSNSVVTSMSVIMDHPNGTKTYITDGEPAVKPTVVGSPASLMSPDRFVS